MDSYNKRKIRQREYLNELEKILSQKESKAITKSLKKLTHVCEGYILIDFRWYNILAQARVLEGKNLEMYIEKIAELASEYDED